VNLPAQVPHALCSTLQSRSCAPVRCDTSPMLTGGARHAALAAWFRRAQATGSCWPRGEGDSGGSGGGQRRKGLAGGIGWNAAASSGSVHGDVSVLFVRCADSSPRQNSARASSRRIASAHSKCSRREQQPCKKRRR
jgi:hypothetical protein